jgi:hypothetical protein
VTVSILSILAALIPFIIDAWQKNQPERKRGVLVNDRINVANGAVDRINDRLDRVLSIPSAVSGIAGKHDTTDILQRVKRITGADILPDRT